MVRLIRQSSPSMQNNTFPENPLVSIKKKEGRGEEGRKKGAERKKRGEESSSA